MKRKIMNLSYNLLLIEEDKKEVDQDEDETPLDNRWPDNRYCPKETVNDLTLRSMDSLEEKLFLRANNLLSGCYLHDSTD